MQEVLFPFKHIWFKRITHNASLPDRWLQQVNLAFNQAAQAEPSAVLSCYGWTSWFQVHTVGTPTRWEGASGYAPPLLRYFPVRWNKTKNLFSKTFYLRAFLLIWRWHDNWLDLVICILISFMVDWFRVLSLSIGKYYTSLSKSLFSNNYCCINKKNISNQFDTNKLIVFDILINQKRFHVCVPNSSWRTTWCCFLALTSKSMAACVKPLYWSQNTINHCKYIQNVHSNHSIFKWHRVTKKSSLHSALDAALADQNEFAGASSFLTYQL